MISNFFTNEIVMKFPQGNICFTSNLIFLETLNGPIDYLFMNIAFNFIVRFSWVFFARNGTKSLICHFYIMPQTGYAMFTLFAPSYNST